MRRPGSAWGRAVCTFQRRVRTGVADKVFHKDLKKDL